jgi:hypothetical protein
MLAALMTLALAQATGEPPQDNLPVAGLWELKSVTVNGRAATKPEMATLLKAFGGVEAGMAYKFRSNGFGSMNGFGVFCQFFPETKELVVMSDQEGNDQEQPFDARLAGKTLRLGFRDGNRTVAMLFTPGE